MSTKTLAVPASLAFAEQLFTKRVETFNCLGPEKINKAFGIVVDPTTVPSVPFSEEELHRAHELGQFLILQTPTTMWQLHDQFGNKLGDGKLLCNIDWYKNEEFYTTESTKLEWKLVGREVIPGSTDVNFLGQTQALADYVRDQVYAGMEIPTTYQAAIAEFEDCKDMLRRLMDKDWKLSAEKLAELKLNQLFRGTPVETLYNCTAYFKINGEYLLPGMYHWSARRSSYGDLVYLGGGGAVGVRVYVDDPGFSSGRLGVVFSRSATPVSVP